MSRISFDVWPFLIVGAWNLFRAAMAWSVVGDEPGAMGMILFALLVNTLIYGLILLVLMRAVRWVYRKAKS